MVIPTSDIPDVMHQKFAKSSAYITAVLNPSRKVIYIRIVYDSGHFNLR